MPLAPTAYYTSTVAPVHQALVAHRLVGEFLSGADVRFDGQDLASMYGFVLPSGELLTSIEFAHLLSIFNNSRVHMQAEKHFMGDEAPPGLYFTVVNGQLIQGPHKNRFGLYEEESGAAGLFLQGLHIDHYFLQNKAAPPALGSIAFALCAIIATSGKTHEMALPLIKLTKWDSLLRPMLRSSAAVTSKPTSCVPASGVNTRNLIVFEVHRNRSPLATPDPTLPWRKCRNE